MKNFITLKTRVSMSFEHSKGIAAIARGTTVRVIETHPYGFKFLIDYGNGIKKWETDDLLTRHFAGFLESGLADKKRAT